MTLLFSCRYQPFYYLSIQDSHNPDIFKPNKSLELASTENEPTEPIAENITTKEVKEQIKKMPNKSPGDKVFPQHLKHGTEKLFTIITIIFNASLKLGYFPDRWKSSIIVMVLKPEKSAQLPTSYRPISLLPIIGKLFEVIMSIRLTKFMINKGLFNKYQCGFRKGKSTTHQLLRLAEHVSVWFNKKPSGRTVAIFIDAEKAFDSVWHQGLKKMLYDTKLPTIIVKWLSSFLDDRTGCIKINQIHSTKFFLRAGVPQGGLLAPLLYIFYIREMPTKILHSLISSFYADDTMYAASDTLHKRSKTFVSDQLQPILTKLETFCAKWRIGLNPEKTWALNFHKNSKNNNTPRLWLKNQLIKYKKECKFLGITFDEKLSYKAHIDNIVTRSRKRLNLLKTVRGKDWGASPQTLLYTYKSYVRPILEYGSILFAYAEDNLLKKIQAVETEAIKIAFRLPPWTTNYWCYQYINFEGILVRLKNPSQKISKI